MLHIDGRVALAYNPNIQGTIVGALRPDGYWPVQWDDGLNEYVHAMSLIQA